MALSQESTPIQPGCPGTDTCRRLIGIVPKEILHTPIFLWGIAKKWKWKGKERQTKCSLEEGDGDRISIMADTFEIEKHSSSPSAMDLLRKDIRASTLFLRFFMERTGEQFLTTACPHPGRIKNAL